MKKKVKIFGYNEEIEIVLELDEYFNFLNVQYVHPKTGECFEEIDNIKRDWNCSENFKDLIEATYNVFENLDVSNYFKTSKSLDIETTIYGSMQKDNYFSFYKARYKIH